MQISERINQFASMSDALNFFEISHDPTWLEQHGEQLQKRFAGNLLLHKPSDWFGYRRALKAAYCRINRQQLPAGGRAACRGCLSCERR